MSEQPGSEQPKKPDPHEDQPSGERPENERSENGRAENGRPVGERLEGERPEGERPEADARPDDTHSREPGHDRRMLEALVCPLTQTTLSYDAESGELISRAARLAFPVRAGIPIMLVSEARDLD